MPKVFLKRDDVDRIWAAVLLQACKDVVSPDASKAVSRATIRRQALAWIMSTRTDTCSFIGVCLNLGMDPHNARLKILQLPRDVSRREKRLLSMFAQGFCGQGCAERSNTYG